MEMENENENEHERECEARKRVNRYKYIRQAANQIRSQKDQIGFIECVSFFF